MYLRGNQCQSCSSGCQSVDVGLTLQAPPGQTACSDYLFSSHFTALTIGLRLHSSGAPQDQRLVILLDRAEIGRVELAAWADRNALLDAQVSTTGGHELSLLLEGSGAVIIRDLIIRRQGQSADPFADELLLEEGRYWQRYVEAYLNAGDRTILDGMHPGTHPALLELGISTPDQRDRSLAWGLFTRRETQFFFAPFKARKGGWGLDLACGAGQFTLHAARQGVRMVGIDLSDGLLHHAANQAAQAGLTVDYLRAEGSCLPFRDERFDIAGSKSGLHHLPDVESGFRELLRILKSGGAFIAFETVRQSQSMQWLMRGIRRLLLPLVLRRHPRQPAPGCLHYGSPLEDSGAQGIMQCFNRSFLKRQRLSWRCLDDWVRMHTWYAFGRLRPVVIPLARALVWPLESAILLARGPVMVFLSGEKTDAH
jgi:SAM-dependent methyltransferase